MLYSITKRANPLDRTDEKFYASPSYTQDVSLEEISAEISKRCSITPADTLAVLKSLADVIPLFLLDSHPVNLGGLGRMRYSFSSKGKLAEEEVTAEDVTKGRIIFIPSKELKERIGEVHYEKR